MLYRRDLSGPTPRLEKVDPASLSYDPGRRQVIMFPGGAVYQSMMLPVKGPLRQRLSGSIKYVEQTLEPLNDKSQPPVDVYLYTYDYGNLLDLTGLMKQHFRKDTNPPASFSKAFGEDILLRLMLKPGEKLEQLSKAEVKERISHLTCIGHSMGSVLNQDAAYCLTKRLSALGWKDDEVAEAAHELVTVSLASVARQDMPAPNATQFFFTSINDTVASGSAKRAGRDAVIACGYDPDDKPLPKEEEGKARPVPGEFSNRYRIRLTAPETISWQEKGRDGTMKTRTIDNKGKKPTDLDIVAHDYRAFLYGMPEVRDHLRNVVLNAVTRKPGIGDGHELLKQNSLNISLERSGAEIQGTK